MPGVVKRGGEPWGNFDLVPVTCPLEAPEDLAHIVAIVHWTNTDATATLLLFVDIAAIVLLDARGIFEHDASQISRGPGEVDLAGEPLSRQYGERAGVWSICAWESRTAPIDLGSNPR